MKKAERFSIYRHSFVYGNNLIVTKQFIVLNHADGTRTFTDFHRYVENPNKKVKKFNEDGNNRFIFINKFLNYAFFTIGISSLSDLTVDIGRNFLNAYGMHELPDDDEYVHRGKGTVEKCIKAVLDFYINLTNDKSSGCKIKSADLYRYITVRDKYGKAIKKMIPQFDVKYIPSSKEPIFRDIPNKAFTLLFDHIAINHTELLGLVMHQAFAGLRPSEACNVRRIDSPLGAGIRIREVNGKLCGVSIDLRDELNLRSDLLSVGNIKKERIAKVPDIFLSAYKDAYEIYMAYRKYELVFHLSFEDFTDYAKAYCISIFGKNELISIENTLLDIKHLLNKGYEEVCGEMSDLRLYSVNRISDFLSLLVIDDNAEAMERLISALDFYADIKYGSQKGFNQRELADFDSYFEFDDIIKDYWNSDISPEDRFFYYPLYIWWILTAVIPLRPREFLLTERDCIYKNSDGRYHLKLRRNLLKGGAGGELSYKISDAYHTQPIPIPDYLGKIIENYIIETDKYEHTAIDTLFVTDPHYRKWGQHKHSDSRFLTYMNMNTILKYFFKEIVHEKYGYTIVYDNGEVNHENKEIRYIHLGDTRHIAFINLMQEGATPVTAMLLGGHTNIEMASHYYSNVIQFIECQTYRQYRKCICGDVEYKLSHADNLPPADEFKLLSDGGICYSSQYQNGSISDCINVSGPNGEIGYCPECVYYRKQGTSYFSSDDIYKRHIEEDSKTLFLAVQSVMEGKGNTENINEAILKLNSSNYSYKAYLLEKYVHEGENNG